MNTYERIGQAIKRLRSNRGLTQEQFSDQCGVDQHYISNIERGKRSVSVDIIERIASYFGMSLSQFFESVERFDEPTSVASDLPTNSIVQQFANFMKAKNLSERTIKKNSYDTPNSHSVQEIITSLTGYTKNMYDVRDIAMLDRIIERVANSDFNIIGHSMYSAGLKKFKLFLQSIS